MRAAVHTAVSPGEYDRSRVGPHERQRVEIVKRFLDADGVSLEVLEFGCGTGRFLAQLSDLQLEHRFLGVDTDVRLVDFANATYAHERLRYIAADVRHPWVHPPADVVLSVDVLHHVTELPGIYAAIAARMKPGAKWLAFEPNVWHPFVSLQQERMRRGGLGENHFRPWRERPRIEAAGLRVVDRRYLFGLPNREMAPWIRRTEAVVAAHVPMLAGGVLYTLMLPGDARVNRR